VSSAGRVRRLDAYDRGLGGRGVGVGWGAPLTGSMLSFIVVVSGGDTRCVNQQKRRPMTPMRPQCTPNARSALLACMEYMEDHLADWLGEELAGYGEEDYLVIDCPGALGLGLGGRVGLGVEAGVGVGIGWS